MALFAEQTINYFKKIIKVAWHFSDSTASHILGGLKSKPPAQLQAKKKKKEEEKTEGNTLKPAKEPGVKNCRRKRK